MSGPRERNADVSRRTVLRLAASGLAATAAGSAGAALEGDDAPDENQVRDTAREAVSEETGTGQGLLDVVDVSRVCYRAFIDHDPSCRTEFWDVKVIDSTDEQTHVVRVDADGQQVDREQTRQAAAAAWRDEYGVLSMDLHEWLQDAPPDAEVPIAIWTDGPDRAAAREAVEFESAPTAPQTQTELADKFQEQIADQTEALDSQLADLGGLEVTEAHGGAPFLEATATTDALRALGSYDAVQSVYYREVPWARSESDPGTVREVEGSGSDETDAKGYAVGVFEQDAHPKPVETVAWENEQDGAYPNDDHASEVAIAAVSDDPNRPGMAPGASVYTSYRGDRDTEEAGIDFLLKHAPVVNCSFGVWEQREESEDTGPHRFFEHPDRRVYEPDLRYGSFVFNKRATIVKSAGNETKVTSPGRGLNLLTVGGVSGASDEGRVTDHPFSDGSSVSPNSEHDGVETPECSARAGIQYRGVPEDDEEGPVPEEDLELDEGTSLAAPRVAGLVTLMKKWAEAGEEGQADAVLTDRKHVRPEVARAIAVASTTKAGEQDAAHNGAGTVVASNAKEVVAQGTFEVGAMEADEPRRVYELDEIEAGDTVTVALSWLSDPTDCEPFADPRNLRSDVDLDLEVNGPCRQCHPMTASRKSDGGWEHLQFQAHKDDGFEVVVRNADWNSSDSHREFCVAWHGTSDDKAPEQPPDIRLDSTSPTSVDVDCWGWDAPGDAAGDVGDAGTDRYRVYVDGRRTVDHPVNGSGYATVEDLAPDTEYTIEVAARDHAGNESPKSDPITATTDPADLLLHDFDGSPAWPTENELGNDCVGSYLENDEVVDGALRLDYDGRGYFVSEVEEDVSAYSELKFRARFQGYDGSASHCRLSIGGMDERFDRAIGDDDVTNEYSVVSVDLTRDDVDASNPEHVVLNFFGGEDGAGVLEIDNVWFAQ